MALEVKAKAVVCEGNPGGKVVVRFLPGEFVGEVGEECFPGFEGVDGREGFVDGHVGVVVLVAEGVDDE